MIAALIAHIALHGRHHHTATISGWHWTYCTHRSHRRRLPCWRWQRYDSYCARHDEACWPRCPETGR